MARKDRCFRFDTGGAVFFVCGKHRINVLFGQITGSRAREPVNR